MEEDFSKGQREQKYHSRLHWVLLEWRSVEEKALYHFSDYPQVGRDSKNLPPQVRDVNLSLLAIARAEMIAADTRGVWETSLLFAHSLTIQKAWSFLLLMKNN